MDVREVVEQREWDGFVAAQPESQFLQSWQWGEFQRAVGRRVFRFGVYHNGRIVAAAQCTLQSHGLGIRSLAVYRGPILDQQLDVAAFTEALESLLQMIEACGREYGATYVHLEPPFTANAPAGTLLAGRPNWIAAPSSQPRHSQLLSLAPRVDELFATLHEKTRYNARLAERKGVIVSSSNDPKEIAAFLPLLHATAKRDRITSHADAYYKQMADVLAPSGFLCLFRADYENKLLAANLVYQYGDTVAYAHGASSNEQRNVMAPHLLQWKQIEWARKQEKFSWYDFWGVAPREAGPEHSWAGITRFKKGFGGEYRAYLQAMEHPIRNLSYRLVRLRRKLRG